MLVDLAEKARIQRDLELEISKVNSLIFPEKTGTEVKLSNQADKAFSFDLMPDLGIELGKTADLLAADRASKANDIMASVPRKRLSRPTGERLSESHGGWGYRIPASPGILLPVVDGEPCARFKLVSVGENGKEKYYINLCKLKAAAGLGWQVAAKPLAISIGPCNITPEVEDDEIVYYLKKERYVDALIAREAEVLFVHRLTELIHDDEDKGKLLHMFS